MIAKHEKAPEGYMREFRHPDIMWTAVIAGACPVCSRPAGASACITVNEWANSDERRREELAKIRKEEAYIALDNYLAECGHPEEE